MFLSVIIVIYRKYCCCISPSFCYEDSCSYQVGLASALGNIGSPLVTRTLLIIVALFNISHICTSMVYISKLHVVWCGRLNLCSGYSLWSSLM